MKRKRVKRWLSVLGIASSVVMALSACGSGDAQSKAAQSGTDSTNASADSESGTPGEWRTVC